MLACLCLLVVKMGIIWCFNLAGGSCWGFFYNSHFPAQNSRENSYFCLFWIKICFKTLKFNLGVKRKDNSALTKWKPATAFFLPVTSWGLLLAWERVWNHSPCSRGQSRPGKETRRSVPVIETSLGWQSACNTQLPVLLLDTPHWKQLYTLLCLLGLLSLPQPGIIVLSNSYIARLIHRCQSTLQRRTRFTLGPFVPLQNFTWC